MAVDIEEQEKKWLALPLGEVLSWLGGRVEELWDASVKAGLEKKVQACEDYNRVESFHRSLARVVAWLAGMQPPQASQDAPQGVPATTGRLRARGRVCVSCRRQIRKQSELMTIAPVQMPGLTIHRECFVKMEEEFGGKQ